MLTSIIFLFIKHPYDVGDRVTIGDKTYTVKEMRLLSTIFLDSNACQVQAPNTWMNTQLIHNIRRSPQVSAESLARGSCAMRCVEDGWLTLVCGGVDVRDV